MFYFVSQMKIFLDKDRGLLSPLGEINATISKMQLVLLAPTLVRFGVSITHCVFFNKRSCEVC